MNKHEENIIPSIIEFYLNVPLYKPFPCDEHQDNPLSGLPEFKGTIDCYCISCQQSSVFSTDNYVMHLDSGAVGGNYGSRRRDDEPFRTIEHIFYCSRNKDHQILFFFLIQEKTITKIGQYPSLVDLTNAEIRKYRRVLGNDSWREFSKAIDLTSRGIGIGAFVYFRRIFENLVEEAHKKQALSSGWDEKLYKKNKMDGKIQLLKESLPNLLVINKSLYSILSKGIHELNEDECLNVFPIIKLGIELILDEKIEKLERDNKIKLVSRDINKLNQQFKS